MKKYMQEDKIRNQKGIILLVLVITIIVLLILAGVTISVITGDDGTIVNASKAKLKTEIRDIEEKIELEEINHNNGEEFQFGTLKDLIGREDEYNEILYMEDGKLVYLEDKVSDKQAEWLEEMGINAKQNIIPIYTGEQFKKIGTGEEIQIEEAGGETYQFNMDSHYVLQNNINLNCNDENQWVPIGTSSDPFKGILDGKGYTISEIYINSGEQRKALFNYNNGQIQNIVVDGYINGSNFNAGIVAENNVSGKIINCVNYIELYATGNQNGGIVGSNSGIIENCENRGYLELNSTSGGICGNNTASGSIKKCKNTHEIVLKDFNIGGVVGENSGTIEECYNLGNILTSTSYARYGKGGIAGKNYGIIKKCYNLAEIRSNNWNVGGIAGGNEENGSIEFSYNIGQITGSTNIGGIAGGNAGNIRYSYTIDTNEMIGSDTGTVENCMQLSEKQMKNKENITLDDGSVTSFLELLNKEGQYFLEDTKNENKGYPVFE